MSDIESDAAFNGKDVVSFCKHVMSQIRDTQKSSMTLNGWQLYTDYSGVQPSLQKVNMQLLELVNKLFKHQNINVNLNEHQVANQLEVLRDGNDLLLEKINSQIDEAVGIRKDEENFIDTTIQTVKAPVSATEDQRRLVLVAQKNIEKPQMFFSTKIDNTQNPFVPLLTIKPHSLKPLAIMLCEDLEGKEYYGHPYEYELTHYAPSPTLLKHCIPCSPPPMLDTPYEYIDTEEQLTKVISELSSGKEIAVDVEHHSFRTYLGLTCLIQLSSRTKDYIIDTIALRGKLELLNEVFTDKGIVKILHGADSDILWLQRDCGVYVVNMFDTHQAAMILDYPHKSLSSLLLKFCSVNANKWYQRADWRIRPLPDQFVTYARTDTHYLLYIYDLLRNELINNGNSQNNLLHSVLNRSTELCLQRYEKPQLCANSHLELCRSSRKLFNNRQIHALKSLYEWRDKLARQLDESVEYILPKHMMLQIAEILPKELQGILACCNPIPSMVKAEQFTLHNIVRSARDLPLIKVLPNLGEPLYDDNPQDDGGGIGGCHDLSQVDENPVGLSTLIQPPVETLTGDLFTQHKVQAILAKAPRTKLFGSETLTASLKHLQSKTPDFMSPFQRFQKYMELQPTLEFEKTRTIQQEVTQKLKEIRDEVVGVYEPETSERSQHHQQYGSTSNETRIDRLKSLVDLASSSASSQDSIAASGQLKGQSQLNTEEKMDGQALNKKPRSKKKRNTKPISEMEGYIPPKKKNVPPSLKSYNNPPHVNPPNHPPPQNYDYANASYSVFSSRPQNTNKKHKFKEGFRKRGRQRHPGGDRMAGVKSKVFKN